MTLREPGWTTVIGAILATVLIGCGTDGSNSDQGAVTSPQAGNGGAAGTLPQGGTAGAMGGTGGAGPVAGTTAGTTAGTGSGGTAAAGTGGLAGTAAGAGGAAGVAGAMAGTGGMTGGAGGMGGDAGADTPAMGTCGPETTFSGVELGNTDNLGPFTPTHVESTGPSGVSWIFYPEELGEGGMKHPVFQWGPGAFTGPREYTDHLNLLASHGFVVISQASTNSGREALTWILAENDKMGSMFYQKLDPERVGRGGHSMGALQSMSEADDDRLMLYVLVCGGASGGGGADDIDDATIFLGGEGLGDTTNFEADYAEVTGPTVFIRRKGTDHIQCARDNLAPWVAFMRWHFCGEEKWKADFEPGGVYCTGDWAACETKNL